MKHMALAPKNSRSNGSSIKGKSLAHSFMICVRNDEHAASLELRKLYELVPDPKASRLHLVRVIDESGQDYLYPEDYFVAVKLPQSVGRAVLRAAQ
jgi:hypothetical protein